MITFDQSEHDNTRSLNVNVIRRGQTVECVGMSKSPNALLLQLSGLIAGMDF